MNSSSKVKSSSKPSSSSKVKSSSKPSSSSKVKSSSKTLVSKSSSKVKALTSSKNVPLILSHQLDPIRYLVSRCKDQHGLLINHIFGSGKTLIPLFLAKNYPDKKVVLIAPIGIISQWINQAKLVGVKIHLILNFDELTPELLKKHEKIINDSILIFDEAHNIVGFIENITEGRKIGKNGYEDDQEDEDNEPPKEKQYKRGEQNQEKTKKVKKEAKNALIEVLSIFKTAKKVLLLSGTPIRDNIADFRWLVNIAAGKRIFPYNINEFKDQYYYKNPVTSFINGWLTPILNIRDPVSNEHLIPFSDYIDFRDIEDFKPQFTKHAFNVLGFMGLLTKIKINLDPATDEYKNEYKDAYEKQLKEYKKGLIESGYNFITAQTSRDKFFQWAIFAIFVTFGFIVVIKIKNRLMEKYNFDSLNINKIKIASPYISYYKYDNLDYYPSTKICNTRVQYTEYQLSLFTRLTANLNITDQESVNLEFNKTLAEAELFKPTYISSYYLSDKYFVNGRKIGNLKGINPINPKQIDYPNKFIKIAERFKSNPQQTLIYSSFSNSLYDLQDYLKKCHGINSIYFHPKLSVNEQNKIKEDYYKQKIKIVLIHPGYYEGFDIKGVRVFHILEPVMEYFKREQLYARPVRYLSHAHLPKDERNVTIIQWICSVSDIFDKINKQKHQFSNWFSSDKSTVYFARMQSIKTDYTADESVFNSIEKIADKIEDIQNKMKTIRIDKSEIPLLCNVYGDTGNKNLKSCKF
jgi:Helicase conserved C-terminal domain